MHTWASLIAVTLLSLAAGYWMGGWLADRRGSRALFDGVVGAAGLLICLTPALVRLMAEPLAEAGFELGLLLTTTLAIGPALAMVGMTGPLAVHLATKDTRRLGRSVGSVYGWSTVGGVMGAMVAGFVLLPVLPVSRICLVTGAVLVVWALVSTAVWTRWGKGVAITAALAVTSVTAVSLESNPPRLDGFRLVEREASYYGSVQVVEDSVFRYLLIDGMGHSVQTLAGREPAMLYVEVLGALPYLRPGARDMLLLGLGAGDTVRLMQEYGIHTTAVEIDPTVARAAFDHFGLQRSQVDVVIEDGRRFLNASHQKFDFVVLDAYAGAAPASHLFTLESFAGMRGVLNPDGIVAVNIVVDNMDHPLVGALGATLARVLPHVVAVGAGEPEDKLANVILFASASPIEFPKVWEPAPRTRRRAELLSQFPTRVVHWNRDSPIITDDFNPVDSMITSTERSLREMSRNALPEQLLEP